MEWIRISQNKLKIMLTAEDARRYELNCESADYTDVLSRTAFREILTDVQQQTGFDATEDKVYIQMYPSKEGGCELFVTKIGLPIPKGNEGATKPARNRKSTEERCCALLFTALPDLLSLCRRLSAHHHVRQSSLWRDENDRWWLLMQHTGAKKLSFLSEYGRETPFAQARLFLAEHGTLICQSNAIETMGRL